MFAFTLLRYIICIMCRPLYHTQTLNRTDRSRAPISAYNGTLYQCINGTHINRSDSKMNTLFHLVQQPTRFSRTPNHGRRFRKHFKTEINSVLKSEMQLLLYAIIIAT